MGLGVTRASAGKAANGVGDLSSEVIAAATPPLRSSTYIARSQSRPATAPLNVVGLGDSVPSGGACGCVPFVQTAGDDLAKAEGRTASVNNLAVGGYTSDDVVAQLDEPAVRDAIAESDLVIIEVGANDFNPSADDVENPLCADAAGSGCYTATASSMVANLNKIVSTVDTLQTNPGGQVVLMGYWGVFADGEVASSNGQQYVVGSDSLTRWVNSMVAGVAKQQGVVYADAYTPFKGADGSQDDTAYLADDGEHPNQTGHQLLARAVVDAVS